MNHPAACGIPAIRMQHLKSRRVHFRRTSGPCQASHDAWQRQEDPALKSPTCTKWSSPQLAELCCGCPPLQHCCLLDAFHFSEIYSAISVQFTIFMMCNDIYGAYDFCSIVDTPGIGTCAAPWAWARKPNTQLCNYLHRMFHTVCQQCSTGCPHVKLHVGKVHVKLVFRNKKRFASSEGTWCCASTRHNLTLWFWCWRSTIGHPCAE